MRKRLQQIGDRDQQFTRRAAIVAGGQGVLLAGLVGRMYYLQVVEADQYRMLAEENRISMRLLPPLRGRILDRNGVELASNRLDYRVILIPEQVPDLEATLAELEQYLPLDKARIARIRKQIDRQRPFLPVTVADNLSWPDFAEINVHLTDLPGVHPDAGETRAYRGGEAFAHVVGYVGPVSEEDLKQSNDPLLELPGFKIGRSGIERTYDHALRGEAGNSRTEVNAHGRTIRELARQNGEPGQDVRLTLDADLQSYAVDRLGTESAAVTLMDVDKGDLLVAASTPAFDPAIFNLGVTQRQWRALLNDPKKPLVNKVIAGQYPPGSTFKTVVGLAALESGLVDPAEEFYCNGKVKLGDQTFHCWKERGHGHMDLHHAIQQSCDSYFYLVARRLGIARIAAMAERFGLGQRFDIGLNGVKSGVVPSDAWKRAHLGERWQGGETLITGIGQGYLLATPLQLAVMTARIANGGMAIVPRLVRGEGDDPTFRPDPAPLGVAPRHVRRIQAAMNAVSNTPRGTAYRARIEDRPYKIAGKTGTAQVRRISKEEREEGIIENEDLEWRWRDHALFTAFAPVEAPRFAISVVVEHGGSGSGAAAPVARDVMQRALERYLPNETVSLDRRAFLLGRPSGSRRS